MLAIEADLSKRGIGPAVLSMGGERLDTRNPTSKLMLTKYRPGMDLSVCHRSHQLSKPDDIGD